jgi:hypothetical protein
MLQTTFGDREVKQVSDNTLCFEVDKVKQALVKARGNVDDAIEMLIEQLAGVDVDSCTEKNRDQEEEALETGSDCCVLLRKSKSPDGVVHGGVFVAVGAEMQHRCHKAVCVQVSCAVERVLVRFVVNNVGEKKLQSDRGGAKYADIAPVTSESADKDVKPTCRQGHARARNVEGDLSKGTGKLNTTRPANNKPCPCGSRLKYKVCCKRRDVMASKRTDGNIAALNVLPHVRILDI